MVWQQNYLGYVIVCYDFGPRILQAGQSHVLLARLHGPNIYLKTINYISACILHHTTENTCG